MVTLIRKAGTHMTIALLVILTLVISANLTSKVKADEISGSCGSACSYAIDLEEGTLIISGQGALDNMDEIRVYSSEIKSIIIEEGITSIPDGSFSSFTSLKSVTLPEGLTKIPNGCFFGRSGLTDIVIPSTVKEIGDQAFTACMGLETIEIPVGVEVIGNAAFEYCYGLKSIVIPNTVKSIGQNLFQNCSNLETAVLPDGITALQLTFSGCTSLKNVTIPGSVTSISSGSFGGCPLENIYFNGDEDSWNAILESIAGNYEDDVFKNANVRFSGLGEEITFEGYQMASLNNSEKVNIVFRSVFSIADKIDGRDIVEKGFVYGLEYGDNPISEKDIWYGNSEYVYTYKSTPAGLIQEADEENNEMYAMTMIYDDLKAEALTSNYFIRAYAKLDNGMIVYTPVHKYNVFNITKYYYDNELFKNKDVHELFYNKILSVVDSEYPIVEYSKNNLAFGQ